MKRLVESHIRKVNCVLPLMLSRIWLIARLAVMAPRNEQESRDNTTQVEGGSAITKIDPDYNLDRQSCVYIGTTRLVSYSICQYSSLFLLLLLYYLSFSLSHGFFFYDDYDVQFLRYVG